MASRRPKLPPEITAPPASVEQPTRRVHVHVVPTGDSWGIRVGRRIEKRFAERSDAVEAAMPSARTRGARLFVHYDSGEIRESATGEGEELLFKAWKQIRAPGGWQGEA